ncbi:MAG: phosphotransferase family protein [Ilumatobacteraceae bacterium]
MAVTVLDVDDLARRAERALAPTRPGAKVSDVDQFTGGTSSLTYGATLAEPGAADRRIVIKAAPPGIEPVRNRDVLRQARILQLLSSVDGVAVPEILATDAGAPVEVPPLFVMSFVDGESYEPRLAATESSATKEQIGDRAAAAATMAALLHAVETDDPRLEGERITDLVAEVGRWSKAFSTVEDDLRPGADAIEAKLLASIPEPLAPSVLHGDWRLGNMQCNGSSIDAVIDWEIWSLGDRRLDLGWFLLLIDEKHPNCVRQDTGLPTPAELVRSYEAATGVTVQDLAWFEALVRYKQAAVSALIAKNNRKVPQPGVDIDRMVNIIPQLLSWAGDFV